MLACPVQAAHKQQVIIAGCCAKVYDEGVTGTMGDDHTFTGALMTAAVRAPRKHAGAADKRFIYVNVRECCVVNGSQRSFTRGCQVHSRAELEFFAQVHAFCCRRCCTDTGCVSARTLPLVLARH